MTDDINVTETTENNDKEYEDICMLCRRPESKAGKMITMQGGICLCADCLQKTLNSLEDSGAMQVFNFPPMPGMPTGAIGNNGNDGSSDSDKGNGDKNNNDMGMGGFGDVFRFFMGDMGNIPQNQKLKKKKAKPKTDEPDVMAKFDIKNLKPPHVIKAELDDYVVGQEHAKKVMSVAVYNHYKRAFDEAKDGIELEKSNMLMIGPTGCGKTYLVKTLAKLLNVPLAIADATSLTEAGYIGDDVESVVSKLLAAADNDVERAEKGIIFIDEIDKLAKKHTTNSRDVSGESVQQGLLKLLEGAEIEVPVGAMSKNAMVPMTTIDTSNILFIVGGAFPDLEAIIKRRMNKASAAGFLGELKDKYDGEKDILSQVKTEDLREFGMIPEFLGRLPVVFTLKPLTKEDMIRILTTPKNAIVKQYKKLLAMDEVDLQFDEDALEALADRAMERDIGARALRAIIEEIMLDIMYEIPKDDNIGTVVITKDYVTNNGAPGIIMRNAQLPG
ncbi:MAG: ATP-dependent Clp protease ATP-binding subunit ClpX [Lachnospiraceae bacterium]|nr:ATP-dependent Clp protease ATP-binding subunit ClpX [Lachnospiraceae bacterium]